MPRLRICFFCHKVGINATFKSGNDLRRHILIRHPRTNEEKAKDKQQLKLYRKQILLLREKLRIPADAGE